MKRYDIWLSTLGYPEIEREETVYGEWVKWEDVNASRQGTAKRIYLLEYALRQLAETAERCDGWDSFPSEALEKAYKALDTFF